MLPKHLLDSPERPKQTTPQTAQAQDGAVVPSNTELSSSRKCVFQPFGGETNHRIVQRPPKELLWTVL